LANTGHWIPESEGRGKWHIQRIRSGLLSWEIPLLILSTTRLSRCRQSILSVVNSPLIPLVISHPLLIQPPDPPLFNGSEAQSIYLFYNIIGKPIYRRPKPTSLFYENRL
jgi:hypothetical protein